MAARRPAGRVGQCAAENSSLAPGAGACGWTIIVAMSRLQSLRQARTLIRWMLACFVLAMGVAVAAPVVNPQALSLVCSAGGSVKLVVQNGAEGRVPLSRDVPARWRPACTQHRSPAAAGFGGGATRRSPRHGHLAHRGPCLRARPTRLRLTSPWARLPQAGPAVSWPVPGLSFLLLSVCTAGCRPSAGGAIAAYRSGPYR